jgi:hypothetical protein
MQETRFARHDIIRAGADTKRAGLPFQFRFTRANQEIEA